MIALFSNRKERMYVVLLCLFVLQFVLFTSSKALLPDTSPSKHTKLNESMRLQTQEITLSHMVYDKTSSKIEVRFRTTSTNAVQMTDVTLDASYAYEAEASEMNTNNTKLKTKQIYSWNGGNERTYVYYILDVPDDFHTVRIELKEQAEKDEDTQAIQWFADYRKIKNKPIKRYADDVYLNDFVEQDIKKEKNYISELEKLVEQEKERIEQLQLAHQKLQDRMIYQTENEQLMSKQDLKTMERSKEQAEDTITNYEANIEESEKKVEKLIQAISDTKGKAS